MKDEKGKSDYVMWVWSGDGVEGWVGVVDKRMRGRRSRIGELCMHCACVSVCVCVEVG